MEGYGSKPADNSYGDYKKHGNGGMDLDVYYGGNRGPPTSRDLRSYSYNGPNSSSSYQPRSTQVSSSSDFPTQQQMPPFDRKLKKSKTMSSGGPVWCFSDPEFQRKRRVVSYRTYTMESKVKGSLKRSFTWIKTRCHHMVYRWW